MLSTSLAFANAELVTTKPAAGTTITAPTEIILTFSEAIDPKFSGPKLEDTMKMDIPTSAPRMAKDGEKTRVVPIVTP